jgi:GH15 family glucan-1,4-alpha-glucosidase
VVRSADGFLPIQEYGLIGDCATGALVAPDGSVDWWCPGRFDAPSVFAAILDPNRGGRFRIALQGASAGVMRYVEATNVLRTVFENSAGALELVDFLPFGAANLREGSTLCRIARAIRGSATIEVELAPRFRYGAVIPRWRLGRSGEIVAEGSGQTLTLAAEGAGKVPLVDSSGRPRPTLRFERPLSEGQAEAFVLSHDPLVAPAFHLPRPDAHRALEETVRRWQRWSSTHATPGEYPEAVLRSALALKALTYERTGAVVAAPTMSLPEWPGGVRNWDYRFSWPRDASFSVQALAAVGHHEEAARFVAWLVDNVGSQPSHLRVLYSVTGEGAPERELPHLQGYRNARPVHLGNAAQYQFQLDIYGELVEGATRCGVLETCESSSKEWDFFRRLADFVAENWRTPDHGIWEIRANPRHFVSSKALAWAALDRAVWVARRRDLPGEIAEWEREAAAIHAEVLDKGWDHELGSFRQAYEVGALDASNLLLPIIGFLPGTDPRILATIDRTLERLTVNGLVYRYRDAEDGLPGPEGAFLPCTFWLVEALAMAGRLEEAESLFGGVLARGSPLGLFSEEIDPQTGTHLGNYPQGLSHIGIIRAASSIAKAKAAGGRKPADDVARRHTATIASAAPPT